MPAAPMLRARARDLDPGMRCQLRRCDRRGWAATVWTVAGRDDDGTVHLRRGSKHLRISPSTVVLRPLSS